MNTVATLRPSNDLTPSQLSLVKRTIAADCTPPEFDLFVEVCRQLRLDPFRKQVFPLVFSKDKPDKRRMTLVVSRDGQRSIAVRCGNYRPASEPAEMVIDETLKGPLNPKGIVVCRVRLWQQDKLGEWFPVVGEAYWDEFAPVTDEWAWNEEAGKRKPTGRKALDESGNWAKMPALMIQKVAEMQALRAGWPEEFGGVFGEEEMDRAVVLDRTASEIVEAEATERRLHAIGGKDVLIVDWMDGEELARVPLGQFADRVAEFIDDKPADVIIAWQQRNRVTMQEFWARAKGDALELKKRLEAAVAKVPA
jgi:phage recombination protein Bet